ncbi:MAG: hypothetical protein AAF492_25770, partial [Verrucomicrobiota bacterium]
MKELDREDPRLPIHLLLRGFGTWLNEHGGDGPDRLVAWAEEELASNGLGHLATRIGRGEVLWLLDGLDEIFDQRLRLRAARIIGAWFASEPGRADRLLLASRPHATEQEGILNALGLSSTTANVSPLDEEQQQTFLRNWFEAVYGAEGVVRADEVYHDLWPSLERHRELPRMKGNPLLLAMIATIYHLGKRLPERRADLYDNAVWVLLLRRFGPDAEGGSDRLAREMRLGLMAVARGMMERGQVRQIGINDFLDLLESGIYPDRKPTPHQRLALEAQASDLGCHSGLLRMEGEPQRFEFTHLGFQEFLAARAYAQEREPFEALAGAVNEDAWREVLMLTAGYLFETGPAYRGRDFVEHLLGEETLTGERIQRLALALNAATEAPPGVLPDALAQDLGGRALRVVESVSRDASSAQVAEVASA